MVLKFCVVHQHIYRQSAGDVHPALFGTGSFVLLVRSARHGQDDLAAAGVAGGTLVRSAPRAHAAGVYTGTAELKDGPLRVLPVQRFLKALEQGDLFS